MTRLRVIGSAAAAAIAVALILPSPVAADEEDPGLSMAPGPGDPTTALIAFSTPITFTAAVAQAAGYSGEVLGIRYENPELVGEYYFGSGVSAAAFNSEFTADYGTAPAAVGLIVATTVPDDSEFAARSATYPTADVIEVGDDPFVPAPAVFSSAIESLRTPPLGQEASSSGRVAATNYSANRAPWMPSQAEVQVLNYTANKVTFVSSYWWLGTQTPANVPSLYGVEFEVNLRDVSSGALVGNRGSCKTSTGITKDDYKKHLAAANENWNWKAIRPDGVTVPSSLGAYADYNDLFDRCDTSSFAIGLRYPHNIQYVNGAYGVIFVIDAPKGYDATSEVSATNQAVSSYYCTTFGAWMALTDCMGVALGDWPNTAGNTYQTVLSRDRHWTVPKKCWITMWTDANPGGQVYDTTGGC
ncbi:hypothetical protein [Homoserinibacter sp. GY 40078]|uniref:hypothetical protein n=1 Tax=Homoserinibacter sp. GY 40078 TaxID=2603275 RepID=UPI0011C96CCA|nr:hypothetical protein [Homoserinibacter sp. GY 40078]TXK18881.1 hypothetical protein FVQ89_02780 [Homoserinibacter sp. GY 40078]